MSSKRKKTITVTKSSLNEMNDGKEYKPSVLPGAIDNYVIIKFQLNSWNHMDFSQKFKDTTRIFTIKNLLRERHGRMDDLKIWFREMTESNEIRDEMLMLKDCGVIGKPENFVDDATTDNRNTDENIMASSDSLRGEENNEFLSDNRTSHSQKLPEVCLFFDYKPHDFDDPILLYLNDNMKL